MKNRHLGFGIFVLSLGVLLLLANAGVINWTIFNSLIDLWPLLLVMAGINIIFRHNEIVKVITWLAFLALIICYSIFYKGGLYINNAKWNTSNNVRYEKKANVEEGELKLDLAGTNFSLDSSSNYLVYATFKNFSIKNSIQEENGGKKEYIVFQQKHPAGFNFNSNNEDCNFKINNAIFWDMDIDAGAINGSMDMSDLKVRNLKLDTGAANMKLIFGDKCSSMNAAIEGGASNIETYIPSSVGVKIRMETALSGNNLNELGWTKQGHDYISPNYDNASCKINMDVQMGAGKFNVNMQ